jgi:hypothetical protein
MTLFKQARCVGTHLKSQLLGKPAQAKCFSEAISVNELGMVGYAYNPSYREAKVEG